MTRVIVRERLPYDPRLGRNVNHDSRSRAYRVTAADTVRLTDVQWPAHMPILDQGSLGSCTGNAGVACMGRDPFFRDGARRYASDEPGAVALYSAATAIDDYTGAYPPDDTGSDGLSVAKALKAAGEISGYLWAFTPTEALGALMSGPLLTGVPWYQSMFDPQPDGRVVVDRSRGLAGGHELCVDGYEVAGQKVWFTNSWGEGWGVNGRGWWSFADWSSLLAEQGDVTQFVGVSEPEPEPYPDVDDVDEVLWARVRDWTTRRHTGANKAAATAVKQWWKAKAAS